MTTTTTTAETTTTTTTNMANVNAFTGRDNVLGMATRYGQDGLKIESR